MSESKLSRVDFEVERLKVQAEMESCTYEEIFNLRSTWELYNEKEPYWGELRNETDEELARFALDEENKCFDDIVDPLCVIRDDDLRWELLDTIAKREGEKGEWNDKTTFECMETIIKHIKDANIRRRWVERMIKDLKEKPELTESITGEKVGDMRFYTDGLIADTIGWLDAGPDEMMGYYKDMINPYAKKSVLDQIAKRFPEYQTKLTLEELDEVSERMDDEIKNAEQRKADATRTAIETKIAKDVAKLASLKREHFDWTRANEQQGPEGH